MSYTRFAVAAACAGLLVSCAKSHPEPVSLDRDETAQTEVRFPAGDTSSPDPQQASSCEAAMQVLIEEQNGVSTTCSRREECGFVELSYDACEGPITVNVTKLLEEDRAKVGDAIASAREKCDYVQPPCPAPVVGDPICLAGRCDSTYRVLGRAPLLRLELHTPEGPVSSTMIGVRIRGGSLGGDRSHTVTSDSEGRIELPADWLGAPGTAFSIGFGRSLRQFQDVGELLEASASPVVFEFTP